MITAFSPISTSSRISAPGSIRAFTFLMSISGKALLRQVVSTRQASIFSRFSSRIGPSSDQSPNTILSPTPNTVEKP